MLQLPFYQNPRKNGWWLERKIYCAIIASGLYPVESVIGYMGVRVSHGAPIYAPMVKLYITLGYEPRLVG